MHVRVCRPFAYRRDYAREVTSRKVLGRNGQNVRSRNRSRDSSPARRTRWSTTATAEEDGHPPNGGRPAQVDMGHQSVRIEACIAKLKVNRRFIITDGGSELPARRGDECRNFLKARQARPQLVPISFARSATQRLRGNS